MGEFSKKAPKFENFSDSAPSLKNSCGAPLFFKMTILSLSAITLRLVLGRAFAPPVVPLHRASNPPSSNLPNDGRRSSPCWTCNRGATSAAPLRPAMETASAVNGKEGARGDRDGKEALLPLHN